jgi:hypothetical protein
LIHYCLDGIAAVNSTTSSSAFIPPADAQKLKEVTIHETGHILGMNSDLFPYFRYDDRVTCADRCTRSIVAPDGNTVAEVGMIGTGVTVTRRSDEGET